jgi:hypothetical protein
MTISGIDQARLGQITSLSASSSRAGATTGVDADGDSDGSGVAAASFSPQAQLLSRLQQNDPGKLKTILADIAKKLQAAAQQDGGSQGQALSNLASKFQQAAQTGDLSALRPAHHHHHGHHHGAAAYQQASGETDPLQAAGAGTTFPGKDVSAQVRDIIRQVITQDLGGAATGS